MPAPDGRAAERALNPRVRGSSPRTPGVRQRRRTTLAGLIETIFRHSRGTYGAPRGAAVLARSGQPASVALVGRLMAELGLVASQPRPYKRTTQAALDAAPVADLVGRDFTAAAPGVKLVGDITYLRTWAGWCYLATVIDCCTHRVVGWSMATHMRTELVSAAIDMAATNVVFAAGAIFHSDRGGQYTSAEFGCTLARHGLSGSMGRTGVCWDNALAESFFAALKNELVYRTAFPTPEHARRAVTEYIEVFYNRQRLHSTLGYRTPLEAEEYHRQSAVAAQFVKITCPEDGRQTTASNPTPGGRNDDQLGPEQAREVETSSGHQRGPQLGH